MVLPSFLLIDLDYLSFLHISLVSFEQLSSFLAPFPWCCSQFLNLIRKWRRKCWKCLGNMKEKKLCLRNLKGRWKDDLKVYREENGREVYKERVMVLKRGKYELGREKGCWNWLKSLGLVKEFGNLRKDSKLRNSKSRKMRKVLKVMSSGKIWRIMN